MDKSFHTYKRNEHHLKARKRQLQLAMKITGQTHSTGQSLYFSNILPVWKPNEKGLFLMKAFEMHARQVHGA